MKVTIEITIDDSRATVTVNDVPQPVVAERPARKPRQRRSDFTVRSEPQSGSTLLPVAEVSRRLSVTTRHVYGLIDTGKLMATNIGTRNVRIAESDLLAYIDANRHDPTKEV